MIDRGVALDGAHDPVTSPATTDAAMSPQRTPRRRTLARAAALLAGMLRLRAGTAPGIPAGAQRDSAHYDPTLTREPRPGQH